jgi:hypothetical protein
MIQGKIEGSFNRAFQVASRLETIKDYAGPLLNAWHDVLVEDNRRGVMMGLDGNGNPMKPTKYRHSITQSGAGKAGDKFFNAAGRAYNFNPTSGGINSFGGTFANLSGAESDSPLSGYKPGASNNLTTTQYKKLTGPPLAPRGPGSRVISNYVVEILSGANMVGVEGGWNDVLSKKGVEFLPFHFYGATNSRALFAASIGGENHHLPIRNLIGLRQWGKSQARKELNAWIEWLLTQAQLDYFQRSSKHTPRYVRLKR